MSDVLPLVGLTSLSRLRRANRALKRAVEDCRRELAERERAIDAHRAIVAERERSIRQYQEIVAEHERSIQQYEQVAAEYERAIQSIRQYQEIVAEREQSIRRFEEIAAEHERSIQTIQRYQEIVAEQERSIQQCEQTVANHESAIRQYQEIVAERERSIEQYQRIVAEHDRSIRRYQEIAVEHERAIQSTQQNDQAIAEHERTIRQYQHIVAEHERSIARYQEIAAEHERAIQSIQQYQEIVAEHGRSIRRYQEIVAEQKLRLGFVDNLDQLKRQIAADSEATAELTAIQSRTLAKLHAQLDDIAQLTADLAAKSYVNRGLDELGEGAAELLNYATGERGFAAQAGAWFDWPVRTSFRAGQASISDVNARIVEIPFALGALASLAPGSLILDVGATGSFLALSLAGIGHEVIALDRRPYPLEHPGLRAVAAPIDEWSGPEQPLDAVVCISAPVRAGLDQADPDGSSWRLDRELLDRFRRWLRPGGLLVLSVPARAGVSDSGGQTRDADDIAASLEGWQILEQRFAAQTGPLQWTVTDGQPTPATGRSNGRAVALVRATPTR